MKSDRPDRQLPIDRDVRPSRTPIGQRNRLKVTQQEAGWKYRMVNDVGTRLIDFIEAGYSFVSGGKKTGDPMVCEPSAIDSRVSKSVGGGVKAYLMRIKEDLYKEDQQVKENGLLNIEASMKPKKDQNQYGEGLRKE